MFQLNAYLTPDEDPKANRVWIPVRSYEDIKKVARQSGWKGK